MSTRREMALALLGLPLAARAAEQDMTPNTAPVTVPKQIPKPFSEAAARIISYTIYAEARGESFKGKLAVASVIKTRSVRSKISLAEVCLQSKQFTCWNNLTAVPEYYISGEGIKPSDLEARTECYGIAWTLLVSKQKWYYLTHFYNPHKVTPSWASQMKGVRTIGSHVFGYID